MKRSKSAGASPVLHRAAVLAEVERIVSSGAFAGSARIRKLLAFVVEDALSTQGEGLKGDAIARRFFGRGDDFDPSVDTIVRVEMSKLRRALDRWYANDGGGVRIEIPPGCYVPRFHVAEQPRSGPRRVATQSLTRGPTVAVRPFTSDGAGTLAIAHGLSQRLAGLLARLAYLEVVRPCDDGGTASAAQLVDTAHVIEGSVRALGGTWRVMVNLREPGGRLVWGESYARPVAESTAHVVEDELVEVLFMQLFDFVSGAFVHADVLRARRSGEPARTPYEALIRFPRWFWAFEREDYAEARGAAEAMLLVEPEHTALLATLADLHALSVWTRTADPLAPALAKHYALRAIAADPTVGGPYIALALVHLHAGDGPRMREASERAVAIGTLPGVAGWLLALAGGWERGTALLRHHLSLGLRVPGWYHHALFLDAYRRGDDLEALGEARLIATPNLAWDAIDRAAVLGRLGRTDEARAAVREIAVILPAFAADPRSYVRALSPDAPLVEALLEGLSMAGLAAR